jgi:3-oxoadipate enol-lactonase
VKIKANGIEVNYELHGDLSGSAPWVTLSHSLACNLHMWDAQIETLSKQYRVLAYDTRGHGLTEAPAAAYTLDELADDAKALLDALKIGSTHFVGLSMGGMIGQTLELKYPGTCTTLALCDTTSRYPEAAIPMWAERVKTASTQGMEPLVAGTISRWFTDPFRAKGDPRIDKVTAMIINVDRKNRAINLSIKAKDAADETEAMKKLQSESAAATGGTNLGALLKAKLGAKDAQQ